MVSRLRFIIPQVERAEAYHDGDRDDPSDIWDDPERRVYQDMEAYQVFQGKEASRRQAYIHPHWALQIQQEDSPDRTSCRKAYILQQRLQPQLRTSEQSV